ERCRKHTGQTASRLAFPRRHLRWMDLVLGRNLLRGPVSAERFKRNRGVKLIRKLRLWVICVSCPHCWIHLSTLPSFDGPLHHRMGRFGFVLDYELEGE